MMKSQAKEFALDAVEDAAAHVKHGLEEGGERMIAAMREAAASFEAASRTLAKALRRSAAAATKGAGGEARSHPLAVGILALSLVGIVTLLLVPHRR